MVAADLFLNLSVDVTHRLNRPGSLRSLHNRFRFSVRFGKGSGWLRETNTLALHVAFGKGSGYLRETKQHGV